MTDPTINDVIEPTDPACESLPHGVRDHGPAPGGLRVRSMMESSHGRVFVLVDLPGRQQLEGRYRSAEAARCHAPAAQGVTVELQSRWRSNEPLKAKGDSGPPKIAEGVIVAAVEDGEGFWLKVTRGHGSRTGRVLVRSRGDLLTNWTRIEDGE